VKTSDHFGDPYLLVIQIKQDSTMRFQRSALRVASLDATVLTKKRPSPLKP
jgi:hypothetical protein